MAHTDDEERQVARETADEIEEKHFADTVLPARKALWQAVDDATNALDAAVNTLTFLASNGGFDVEYESGTGSDFGKHLAEARRLSVIAKALMPTGADGDYVERDIRNDAVAALMSGPILT